MADPKKNPFDEISLVHVVRPRLLYDEKKKDKKNMPFESIYFEYEKQTSNKNKFLPAAQAPQSCPPKEFKNNSNVF